MDSGKIDEVTLDDRTSKPYHAAGVTLAPRYACRNQASLSRAMSFDTNRLLKQQP